jgi:hypothetical protein
MAWRGRGNVKQIAATVARLLIDTIFPLSLAGRVPVGKRVNGLLAAFTNSV